MVVAPFGPTAPLEVTPDPELLTTPDEDRCPAADWPVGEYEDALDCCAACCCCRMFCSKFPVGPEPSTDCCCCLVATSAAAVAEFVTLGELEVGGSLELGSQPSTINRAERKEKVGYFR